MVVRCRLKDHEDGLVMLNSYYEDGIFQFAPNNYYGFFFLHTFPSTIAFEFKYALFYKFNIKLSIFVARKCSVQLLSTTLTLKRLVENDVKTNVKHKKNVLTSCTRVVLHPCSMLGWNNSRLNWDSQLHFHILFITYACGDQQSWVSVTHSYCNALQMWQGIGTCI